MPLYEWHGPEEDLVMSCCAQNLIVESVEDSNEKEKFAKGTIRAIDYIEHGITFTEPWEAKGIKLDDDSYDWEVKRVKDDGVFWIDSKTKEPAFTANSAIDDAIKAFICGKMREFLAGTNTLAPKKYTGPQEKYTGPCVCKDLQKSSKKNPFPWETLTKKQFPENCFGCSCGANWWKDNKEEEVWIPVGDEETWNLLLEYNGVETKKLCLFENKIYLLQIIRDMGYISIG